MGNRNAIRWRHPFIFHSARKLTDATLQHCFSLSNTPLRYRTSQRFCECDSVPHISRDFSINRRSIWYLRLRTVVCKRRERVNGIKDIGWGEKLATLLAKSTQAVWKQDADSQLEAKLALWRLTNADPHFVFSELELNNVENGIMSNSRFHKWVDHVESYNLRHPNKKVSIVAKLKNQYSDYELAMMLERAQRDADTSLQDFATKLQNELMLDWRARKIDASELLKILHLDYHKLDFFEDRALNIWNIYVQEYNPGGPVTLFDQLYHAFGDSGLSVLIIMSKLSEKPAALATNIENQLLNTWLEIGVKPELAFKHLLLDRSPEYFLNRPAVEVWLKYAKMCREEGKEDVTLNKMIREFFRDDEIELIISTATTDYGKNMAKELKTAQPIGNHV